MGKFVKLVRSNSSLSPFSDNDNFIEKWTNIADNIQDIQDSKLYLSGLYIYKKYNLFRLTLDNYKKKPFVNNYKSISALISLQNREHLVMSEKGNDLFEQTRLGDYHVVDKAPEAKIDLPFGKADPDSILSTGIDVLNIVINDIKNIECNVKKNDKINCIGNLLNYYNFYFMLYNVWQDCLWNEYYINEIKGKTVFLPPNSPFIKSHGYYLAREFLIQAQRLPIFLKLKKQFEPLTVQEIKVKRNKKGKEYLLTNSLKNLPETYDFAYFNACELYYLELFKAELPALGDGISILGILEVWKILYQIVDIEKDKCPKDTGVKQTGKLLQYSQSLKSNELVNISSKACKKISYNNAKKIVNFLTFDFNKKCDIWGAPLIPISETKVSFLLTPILCPNLTRTIEVWMQKGGLQIDKKGYGFEEYLRKTLSKHLEENPLLSCKKVISLPVSSGEEIDILFYIDNKILVGEAKCLFTPIEPREIFNYYKKLLHGTKQVLRKTTFVKKNLRNISEKINMNINLEAIEVIPFVITNRALGAGIEIGNVDIIDIQILNIFLNGNINLYNQYKGMSEIASKEKKLYKNEKEAGEKIGEHIKNPINIEHYETSLNLTNTLPKVAEEDFDLFILKHEYQCKTLDIKNLK